MNPTMNTLLKFVRNRTAIFCAIAAILCLASGCGKTEKEKEPIVSVQTTPVQRAPISQVVSAEAVVYPLEQATIAPKISSTIRKFYVQRGARVKKGQLLAELENKDLSAAAESSKGDFEQAEANYVTTVGASLPQQIQKAELDAVAAKSAFDAQQKVYESRKELFQQGAIPRRDMDAAEVAFLQARSQNEQAQKQLADLQRIGKQQTLKSAEGSRASAEGHMRAAQALLSYSRITSPIDGVVTDRPLFEGDLAAANQPLLTVMNTSRLIGKAHVPQSEAAVLKVGNPAELKIPGLDEPIKGRVSLVSPALDPGSTTIEVWVEASKPDPALKPGMTVELSMTAKMVKDALVVPTPAIYKNSEGADFVLLAGSDGHAHLKTVQLGAHNAEFTQVTSGVIAGDPVISSGGYALPDNTQIKIEAPAKDEKEGSDKADKAEKPEGAAKPDAKEKD
jgi:multidrug efflux pump subunit AcrA (membrane-fusion protein)